MTDREGEDSDRETKILKDKGGKQVAERQTAAQIRSKRNGK